MVRMYDMGNGREPVDSTAWVRAERPLIAYEIAPNIMSAASVNLAVEGSFSKDTKTSSVEEWSFFIHICRKWVIRFVRPEKLFHMSE